MRAPTIEKPLKVGRVLVAPDYFVYQRRRYKFDRVRHFQLFDAEHATHFLVSELTMSKTKFLEVVIEIDDGTVIREDLSSKKSMVAFKRFRDGCVYLSSQTANARLAGYMNQFERKGYFIYGGLAFHRDGAIKTKRGRVVCQIQKTRIEYRVGGMVLKRAGVVPLTDRLIKLAVDSDLLREILAQLYGVRWVLTRRAGDQFLEWDPKR